MSELSELTKAGRADILPGYTFTPFGLADFGECEAEFARRHIETVGRACASLPERMADKFINACNLEVQGGAFNRGRLGFQMAAHSDVHLPFVTWLALRKATPTLTLLAAGALVTRENRAAVRRAALECAEFTFDPKPVASPMNPASPSTGPAFSEPSVVAA